MEMLERVLDHAAGQGMIFARFEDLWRRRTAPEAPAGLT